MYYPTLEEVKKHKKDGNLIPVYREIVADLETPVSAFLKVNRVAILFSWKVSRVASSWPATAS